MLLCTSHGCWSLHYKLLITSLCCGLQELIMVSMPNDECFPFGMDLFILHPLMNLFLMLGLSFCFPVGMDLFIFPSSRSICFWCSVCHFVGWFGCRTRNVFRWVGSLYRLILPINLFLMLRLPSSWAICPSVVLNDACLFSSVCIWLLSFLSCCRTFGVNPAAASRG